MSSPRWLTHRSTLLTPERPRRPMMCSRIGRSPTGTSGLGMIVVYGRSRVPSPPARMTALIGVLRRVAIAGVEGIGQPSVVEGGDHLGDPVGDRHLRLETEHLADLVERDLVVTRVLVSAHVRDLTATRKLLLDLLHEIELAVVLARAARVEDLAGDALALRVEDRAHGAPCVADVDVRAPELLAEDLELTARPQPQRELVDGEIETHPGSQSIHGGEAQAR